MLHRLLLLLIMAILGTSLFHIASIEKHVKASKASMTSPEEVIPIPLSRSEINSAKKELALNFVPRGTRWEPCTRFICWRDDDPDLPARCGNNTAPTDYSGKDGYPPCCVHLLRDMLEEFSTFLKSNGKEYFVHYGTLLGAVRDRSFIPWTPDLDIAMHSGDLVQIVRDRTLREELWNVGLTIFEEGYAPSHMGRMCFNSNWREGALEKFPTSLPSGKSYYDTQAYADIYLIRENSYGTITTAKGPCQFYREWIYPLGNVTIGNKVYPAPANAEKMVEHIYGPMWRVPDIRRNEWQCNNLPAMAGKPPHVVYQQKGYEHNEYEENINQH